MTFRRATSLLLLAVFLSAPALAAPRQAGPPAAKSPDKEVEEKALALLEETLRDARSLRLPENRARLQALAANLLWKTDARRARALFREAAANIGQALRNAAQAEPQDIGLIHLARQQVFQWIARRDARLAHELLNARPGPPKGYEAYWNGDAERQMEVQIAREAMAADHTQALQIAEASLAQGFPHDLIGLLSELEGKDEKAAASLAASILDRLRTTDLSRDSEAAAFAHALLQARLQQGAAQDDGGQPPAGATPPRMGLDEQAVRALAEMLTAAALATAGDEDESAFEFGERFDLAATLGPLLPQLEAYAPARVAELRARIAPEEAAPARPSRWEALQKLMASGSTDEQLKAAAGAPPGLRDGLYAQAAMKLAMEGDLDRARQILLDRMENPEIRRQALGQIERMAMARAIEQGKLDEARRMLASFGSDEERIEVLVQMASGALQQKGDRKLARQLADEARGLMGYPPANTRQMYAHLAVAQLYAGLEAPLGFEIIEPLVYQVNTLLAAAAVLDGFDAIRYFRDGEMTVQMSYPLTGAAVQIAYNCSLLSRGDFDRAVRLADQFQRPELRLLAHLMIVHAILEGAPPSLIG